MIGPETTFGTFPPFLGAGETTRPGDEILSAQIAASDSLGSRHSDVKSATKIPRSHACPRLVCCQENPAPRGKSSGGGHVCSIASVRAGERKVAVKRGLTRPSPKCFVPRIIGAPKTPRRIDNSETKKAAGRRTTRGVIYYRNVTVTFTRRATGRQTPADRRYRSHQTAPPDPHTCRRFRLRRRQIPGRRDR